MKVPISERFIFEWIDAAVAVVLQPLRVHYVCTDVILLHLWLLHLLPLTLAEKFSESPQ